jgi:hypothetical protein
MNREYITHTTNAHGLAEEQQWARILSSGEPVMGMVVVYLQKMCAAFHEFEPACRAGGINESALPFFRQRMAGRVRAVLTVMDNNGLQSLAGYGELAALEKASLAAESTAALSELAEAVHQANHTVTDALEGEIP